MRSVAIHGRIARPAVAVVGAWDPLLAHHLRLFDRLGDRAREAGLSAVAVALDPPPALFLNGADRWPIYDDVVSRVELMLDSRLDAVVQVDFESPDLEASAEELIDLLRGECGLAELWLGATQTLGRGPAGNLRAIRGLADRLGFRLEVQAPDPREAGGAEARALLGGGCPAGAARVVGRPPLRSRVGGRRPALAVTAGSYTIQPFATPFRPAPLGPLEVRVEDAGGGLAAFDWPAGCGSAYLALVAGPGDRPDPGDGRRRGGRRFDSPVGFER